MDERQRHELGEAAGAPLDLAQHLEVVGPGAGPVDVAHHHRGGRPQAELVGGDHHLGPLGGAHLVGAQVGAHAVVEDLGGRARQGAEAGVAQAGEELAHADPERVGALPDLERGEAVHVHLGQALLDPLEHRDVEVAGEVGVDAALQADLGGPALPGLDRAVHHLVHVQDVGVAAQVHALGPAREAAEAAAEVALVGVVDVAVDHVGDRLAAAPGADRVGHLGDRLDLVAAGAEEALDLGHPRGGAGQRALEDPGQVGVEPRQALLGGGLAPGGVLPLGRQAPGRHRRRLVAPGGPAVARARGARAVNLAEPGGEQGAGEVGPGVVDLGLGGQAGALDQRPRGDGVAQGRHLVGVPVAHHQVNRPGGDRVECLGQVGDLERDPGRDARQPAELDRLLEPLGVGAQEGRAGAHQGVQHIGARSAVAHRDAPAGDPPREQIHRHRRADHPGGRRAVGAGGLDRQQPLLERRRDGGVVEAGGLAHAGAARGDARGDGAAEGDAHAATATAGSGAPGSASPSSSASERTCSRRPGSRKSSSARYSG